MQGSGLMSIPEYVEKRPPQGVPFGIANEQITAKTPIQVAEELRSYADKSLKQVGLIRASASSVEPRKAGEISKELRLTLGDIEAMSHLGNYYASKILGAVHLHLFEKSKDQENKASAIQHLLEAQKHWENYAAVAGKQYNPQLLARTRVLDWMKILDDVKKDVDIARQSARKE